MLSRRAFLASTGLAALLPLAGCGKWRRIRPAPVPEGSVDIHAHVFNGRDVPAAGFVEQVILRDPHRPVEPGVTPEGALVRLLALILFSGTRDAAAELAAIRSGGAALALAAPPEAIERQDERNVAAALARFRAEAAGAPDALRAGPSEEERLLGAIYRDTGLVPDPRALVAPAAEARRLAERIYRRDDGRYLHRSPLLQTIRWAGLLTRDRRDVVAELVRLYGATDQIRAFSPSLVDFSYWLPNDQPVSDLADQVEVMAEIARRRRDVVLLNFVPYCPLRAALASRDGGPHPLDLVEHAVFERGFAGVKLYPPIGFRPTGNTTPDVGHVVANPPDGGALDDELERLYAWCVDRDVPIKTHANNSIAATVCSGLYASPEAWRPVLEERPTLRLNLAHFGGFEESAGVGGRCNDPSGRDWEAVIADMLPRYPNLYFDLGYWTEVADPDSPEKARVTGLMSDLIDRQPLVAARMMYGSDWSMIGREPAHPVYLFETIRALDGLLGGDRDRLAAVMGGNARRFLGLDGDTPARRRLAAFFGPGHAFEAVFPV